MLQTVDVAIAVEDDVLPAHSFVLMANSVVLQELLNSQSQLFNTEQVLQVPFNELTTGEATTALGCMYNQCFPGAKKPVTDHHEALVLLEIGHKYDAAAVFKQAADSLEKIFHTEATQKNHARLPEDTVTKMVDIANASEDFNLSILYCTDWFSHNYKWCRQHKSVLQRLSKTSLLDVLDHAADFWT